MKSLNRNHIYRARVSRFKHLWTSGIPLLTLVGLSGCLAGLSGLVAAAGPDQNGTSGSPVTLNGQSSGGGEGSLTFAWSYVKGPPAGQVTFVTGQNAAVATVVCTGDGDYQFMLTVTDENLQSASDTMWVHITSGGATVIPPGQLPVDGGVDGVVVGIQQ